MSPKILFFTLSFCSGCADWIGESGVAQRLELHVAELEDGEHTVDNASWEAGVKRRAARAEAARQLGCPAGRLTVDLRGANFVVNGCGAGGVFVDVSFEQQAAIPGDRDIRHRHLFVDISGDDGAEIFERWAVAHPGALDHAYPTVGGASVRYYDQPMVKGVVESLRDLARRSRYAAATLDCARRQVALASLSTKGLTLHFAEGCGHRATYAGDLLIGLVSAPADGKLEQF